MAHVVNLLQQSPALKAYIVGHTDFTGTLEVPLKLSKDRAAAEVWTGWWFVAASGG